MPPLEKITRATSEKYKDGKISLKRFIEKYKKTEQQRRNTAKYDADHRPFCSSARTSNTNE